MCIRTFMIKETPDAFKHCTIMIENIDEIFVYKDLHIFFVNMIILY